MDFLPRCLEVRRIPAVTMQTWPPLSKAKHGSGGVPVKFQHGLAQCALSRVECELRPCMMSGETGLASYFVWLASLDSVCMHKEFDVGRVDIEVGSLNRRARKGREQQCGWTGLSVVIFKKPE
jgi:hypothetical protein